jgi:chromosomal replication initiator protein
MAGLTSIWEQFLTIAKEEAGSRVVETWLKAVSLYQWDSLQKVAYVLAPNTFVKEWIQRNYLALLEVHLSRLFHVDGLKVVFIDALHKHDTAPTLTGIVPAHRIDDVSFKKKHEIIKSRPTKSRYHLNQSYLFETFVKGPNNQMAYAAAQAITQKLGNLYNPLFIYGGSGLGKTHLLHAIANELEQKNNNIEILYQPADRFVNEFINSIRFDRAHAFQGRYKNVDVFLVDDIQSISNKEQTQEAFFHIFNAMYDAHKQIVFSSDSYPADINGLAERLRSRLQWGLVADIQVPTLETKIAIIRRKADVNKYEISDEVALFIASQVVSNIRQLEGALIRVVAFASITKQPVSLELAQKVLQRTYKEPTQQSIDFSHVISSIAHHYSVTLSDLRSKNRSKQLSLARQIAMYFMKKLTDKSLHEIALYLGRQDHSTVIHAFRQIEQRTKSDVLFGKQIYGIEQELQQCRVKEIR